MEPRNCRRCGKMFGYTSGMPICDACKRKDEEDFQRVRQYLKENPGARMREVAEACEVSVEKVTRYLREGRLEIKEGANIVLECESCGRSIKSGRFCESCSKQLGKDFARIAGAGVSKDQDDNENNAKTKGGGMKYLKSD